MEETNTVPTKIKQRRGFAAMSEEKQRELAERGGRKVQAIGRGHRWTADEARAIARDAGLASGRARRRR